MQTLTVMLSNLNKIYGKKFIIYFMKEDIGHSIFVNKINIHIYNIKHGNEFKYIQKMLYNLYL